MQKKRWDKVLRKGDDKEVQGRATVEKQIVNKRGRTRESDGLPPFLQFIMHFYSNKPMGSFLPSATGCLPAFLYTHTHTALHIQCCVNMYVNCHAGSNRNFLQEISFLTGIKDIHEDISVPLFVNLILDFIELETLNCDDPSNPEAQFIFDPEVPLFQSHPFQISTNLQELYFNVFQCNQAMTEFTGNMKIVHRCTWKWQRRTPYSCNCVK